jgi:hypothetical protein
MIFCPPVWQQKEKSKKQKDKAKGKIVVKNWNSLRAIPNSVLFTY